MKRITGLHVIVGGTNESRTLELATVAREEDAAVVQLRDKISTDVELLRIAKKLPGILPDTRLIINDRPDIALASQADGVHLGQDDMPVAQAREMLGANAIIGVSTSNIEEAIAAERAGANYIGFGHIFPTNSKFKSNWPRTVEELRAVVAAVSIPVIAIGGITEANVGSILEQGLGGIAVISAISDSPNPRAAIRNFVKLLEEHNAIYA